MIFNLIEQFKGFDGAAAGSKLVDDLFFGKGAEGFNI